MHICIFCTYIFVFGIFFLEVNINFDFKDKVNFKAYAFNQKSSMSYFINR